ncbi:hypothetical protein [Nesterenkonia sandarakina]|uniref:Uncharacterized protein n=1 Tax=Nesterenkonia sandarakina TaxID=272918 RepID=A0A7Z0EA51_9MICC|nr:hypothetical protein [Nesterenkonia sandarakina]NYJ17162.1 hypothetical protein [Nesterenkonia sandarakina]
MNHSHQDQHPADQYPNTQYAHDQYQPYPPAAAGAEAPAKKRRRWPWIAGIIVALLAGVGIGSSGEEEPEVVTETITEEVEVEVEVEPADLEGRREAITAAEEENDELGEELAQRTSDLDTREEELDQREESISTSETEIEENTIPGSGVYMVGEDIQPGTYRSEGDRCYWARLSGFSGTLGDILANDNVSGSAYVTIAPTDMAFETSRCGDWVRQ